MKTREKEKYDKCTIVFYLENLSNPKNYRDYAIVCHTNFFAFSTNRTTFEAFFVISCTLTIVFCGKSHSN
jgi:hypothetical protein